MQLLNNSNVSKSLSQVDAGRGVPPNRRGSGENQAGGPGGNGIGCPRMRKIGRIGGPKVGRGLNFIGLTLFTTVFLQKSLLYIDFDRGP